MAKTAKKVLGRGLKQVVSVDGHLVSVAYPTIKKSVTLDLDACNEEVQEFILIHGAKQILGDSASGKDAVEKYEMASRRIEALYEGECKLSATPDTTSIVAEAVARIKGLTKAAILASIEIQPEVVKEWRKRKDVKHMIHVIYTERSAAQLAENEEEGELEVPGLEDEESEES